LASNCRLHSRPARMKRSNAPISGVFCTNGFGIYRATSARRSSWRFLREWVTAKSPPPRARRSARWRRGLNLGCGNWRSRCGRCAIKF